MDKFTTRLDDRVPHQAPKHKQVGTATSTVWSQHLCGERRGKGGKERNPEKRGSWRELRMKENQLSNQDSTGRNKRANSTTLNVLREIGEIFFNYKEMKEIKGIFLQLTNRQKRFSIWAIDIP